MLKAQFGMNELITVEAVRRNGAFAAERRFERCRRNNIIGHWSELRHHLEHSQATWNRYSNNGSPCWSEKIDANVRDSFQFGRCGLRKIGNFSNKSNHWQIEFYVAFVSVSLFFLLLLFIANEISRKKNICLSLCISIGHIRGNQTFIEPNAKRSTGLAIQLSHFDKQLLESSMN